MRKKLRNLGHENLVRIRRLRKERSASERVLWALLRRKQTGYLFRTQHPIGDYALDFYCPEAKLCVEVDGEQHDARRKQDDRRDKALAEAGILTLRVPSLDLFEPTSHRLRFWLEEIARLCSERSGR